MRAFLYKFLGYGFILFVVLQGVSFLSLKFLERSVFYKPQFVKNAFPPTSFDYVVLGSSTGLTTLDTQLIDSLTGKKGVNFSMDDTSMSSHYLMLQHLYACGHTTKTVVLALVPEDVSNATPQLSANDYRFLPHIREGYVKDYFSALDTDLFSVYTASRYVPLVGVSYFNTELFYPSLLAAVQPHKRNRFDAFGNYSYPEIQAQLPKVSGLQYKNPEVKNPYLEKIVQFCEEHSISLVLYQSPLYATRCEYPTSFSVVNHSDLISDKMLFYDRLHVNVKGRRLCSEIFARNFK